MNDTPNMYVKSDPSATTAPSTTPFVAMNGADVARVFAVGAVVGALSTAIFLILNQYVFGAALCRSGVEGCANAPTYSTIITVVIGIILGVVVLAKVGTYRPLPVAIAVGIAMWGIFGLMSGAAWYWNLLVGAILFGIAYAGFAWIARVRSFIISVIALIAATIIVRLVIS